MAALAGRSILLTKVSFDIFFRLILNYCLIFLTLWLFMVSMSKSYFFRTSNKFINYESFMSWSLDSPSLNFSSICYSCDYFYYIIYSIISLSYWFLQNMYYSAKLTSGLWGKIGDLRRNFALLWFRNDSLDTDDFLRVCLQWSVPLRW